MKPNMTQQPYSSEEIAAMRQRIDHTPFLQLNIEQRAALLAEDRMVLTVECLFKAEETQRTRANDYAADYERCGQRVEQLNKEIEKLRESRDASIDEADRLRSMVARCEKDLAAMNDASIEADMELGEKIIAARNAAVIEWIRSAVKDSTCSDHDLVHIAFNVLHEHRSSDDFHPEVDFDVDFTLHGSLRVKASSEKAAKEIAEEYVYEVRYFDDNCRRSSQERESADVDSVDVTDATQCD